MNLKSYPHARSSIWHAVKVDVGIVWIVDDWNPNVLSVTNDAEAVCEAVNIKWPGHRIIYRDTEGNWDELIHANGTFQRFAPARNITP